MTLISKEETSIMLGERAVTTYIFSPKYWQMRSSFNNCVEYSI